MSYDFHECGHNPARECGDLVERLAERFTPGQAKAVPYAALRAVAKQAITEGVLALPTYTVTTDQLIRRMNHAKDVERRRLSRMKQAGPTTPLQLARAECRTIGPGAWGMVAATARKHGVNVKSLQEWNRRRLCDEAEARGRNLMTCKAY